MVGHGYEGRKDMGENSCQVILENGSEITP